jgi:hypothetical protein
VLPGYLVDGTGARNIASQIGFGGADRSSLRGLSCAIRSMGPPQIGGSALRAAVVRTDAD